MSDPTDDPDMAIIIRANELARQLYAIRGYQVSEGYRFERATHPHERECWRMAAVAFEFLEGTELDEVLNNLDDGA